MLYSTLYTVVFAVLCIQAIFELVQGEEDMIKDLKMVHEVSSTHQHQL